MKKVFYSIISFVLVFSISFLVTSANSEETVSLEWSDVFLTQEEFDLIISKGNSFENNDARASNLIAAYSIGISISGNTLYIAGETIGTSQVVKSGFKEVVIQRRTSSSASWTDYITYEDLYIDEFAYVLTKAVTVPSGYQYRVTCVHYAKKNILSTQKIDNVSNTVAI